MTGVSIPIARMTGIALVGLGIACWPGPALAGMLTYSAVATLYLFSLAVGGEWVGKRLWPAVAVHALLTFLLVQAWLKDRRTRGKKL